MAHESSLVVVHLDCWFHIQFPEENHSPFEQLGLWNSILSKIESQKRIHGFQLLQIVDYINQN